MTIDLTGDTEFERHLSQEAKAKKHRAENAEPPQPPPAEVAQEVQQTLNTEAAAWSQLMWERLKRAGPIAHTPDGPWRITGEHKDGLTGHPVRYEEEP